MFTKTTHLLLACLFVPISLSGCNTGEFTVSPAKGKVTCNGTPVSGGSISFTPTDNASAIESGKPASATIASDGTFKLSTYGRFDGAIVGKHRVTYLGGEEEDNEESEGVSDEALTDKKNQKSKTVKPKASCVQTKEIIVEVKSSGENDFQIELAE